MAERVNYWYRLKKRRERRIMSRARGKKLIHDEDAILDYVRNNQVPTMMQHCIIKVEKKMGGTEKERFISAFNICAATFQNNGFLVKDTMRKTGKGVSRNRKHQRERVAGQKKARYTRLVHDVWRASIKRREAEKRAEKESGVRKSNKDMAGPADIK